MANRYLSLITLVSLLAACSDNSKFTGSAAKAPAVINEGDTQKEPVDDPSTTSGETSASEDPSTNGTTTDGSTTTPGGTGTTTDGVTNDPSTNTIVYGANGVYHIGDGDFGNGSCVQEVATFDLEGTKYNFVFNVEQDATKISILVGRLCGVDNMFNEIKIEQSTSKQVFATASLNMAPVADNQTPYSPFASEITLNRGTYSIAVYSGLGLSPGDLDDFVIGNIKIKADKPIVGTNIQPL